ncbi:hypothetical protein QJS10_CPB04g01054 [Acorus calamus]|uniref:3'-5' exonuclease domain-containing protein n=1 Tax=Acorus calamus TaxID=4465 RepID=A0AAV9F0I5_ACOCL|nr:hypothetical protein QJS10_CPB04g01054 [Acorus calamus]
MDLLSIRHHPLPIGHGYQLYWLTSNGQTMEVIVTSVAEVVERWVEIVTGLHHGGAVGSVFIQWGPRTPPTSCDTLQICVSPHILIFQISCCETLENVERLRAFLDMSTMRFVGVAIQPIRDRLSGYGMRITQIREIRQLVLERFGVRGGTIEEMAEQYLGLYGMQRPARVMASDWSIPMLTEDQVFVAATYVYIAHQLGVTLY